MVLCCKNLNINFMLSCKCVSGIWKFLFFVTCFSDITSLSSHNRRVPLNQTSPNCNRQTTTIRKNGMSWTEDLVSYESNLAFFFFRS